MEMFRHRFWVPASHCRATEALPCDRVPTFAHALCRPWHLHGSHALPCRCVSSQSRGQYAFAPVTACTVEAYDDVAQRKVTNAGLRAGSTDILHREVWLIFVVTVTVTGHRCDTHNQTLMDRGSRSNDNILTCRCSAGVLSLYIPLPAKKGGPACCSC